MTIQKTRQIMGKKIKHLTDDEVLMLISKNEKMIDAVYELAVKKAHLNKKGDTIQ